MVQSGATSCGGGVQTRPLCLRRGEVLVVSELCRDLYEVARRASVAELHRGRFATCTRRRGELRWQSSSKVALSSPRRSSGCVWTRRTRRTRRRFPDRGLSRVGRRIGSSPPRWPSWRPSSRCCTSGSGTTTRRGGREPPGVAEGARPARRGAVSVGPARRCWRTRSPRRRGRSTGSPSLTLQQRSGKEAEERRRAREAHMAPKRSGAEEANFDAFFEVALRTAALTEATLSRRS